MLKIDIVYTDDLTKEDLAFLGNGHRRSEYGNYLRVKSGGEIISLHRDGGEPEDNKFTRDYQWIAPLLKVVYKLGLENGER